MNSKSVPSQTIFKIALTVNIISVIWNIINDCDETYNYWEPLHFLIYGNGFQTWEYSPTYALRSYLYLILYGWPAMLLNWVFSSISKRVLFFIIRVYMAIVTSWLEAYLYKSLKSYLKNDSVSSVPLYSLLILMSSTGSFIASTALLPSSFAFYCSMLVFAGWLRGSYNVTIAGVAMSAIIGWPFSAAIGIPFAIDIVLVQRKFLYFTKTAILWGLIFTVTSLAVDSYFYGTLTLPCWNIVKYNVFNTHGSELYGVESAMYYIKNYLLNFNIAMIPVMLYPIFIISDICRRQFTGESRVGIMAISVFLIWNVIFFTQSHKEERFLFPGYPFLAVVSGSCLCQLEKTVAHIFAKTNRLLSLVSTLPVVFFFLGLGIISAARIVALIVSFSAPFSLYSHLGNIDHITDGKTLCVGREWHRFPSNFLVTANLSVSFIQSDFKGQLPAKFDLIGGSRAVQSHFNDRNTEEAIGRYASLSSCDFIVDRLDEHAQSVNEPNWLALNSSKWHVVMGYRLLSPRLISTRFSIIRSFYVPTLFEKSNDFVDYVLLRKLV